MPDNENNIDARFRSLEAGQRRIDNDVSNLRILLERLVKVEERTAFNQETTGRIFRKLEDIERDMEAKEDAILQQIREVKLELDRWQTARKLVLWIISSAVALGTLAYAFFESQRP